MKIRSYTPNNPILLNSVKCLFLLERKENEPSESFLLLPSICSYLSISLGTATRITSDNIVTIQSGGENLFDSEVQFGLKKSCVYEYRGKVKELCIVFNPLGIYDFFDEQTLLKSAKNGQTFIPDDEYRAAVTGILNRADDEGIFEKVEEHLAGKYAKFSHPYLKKIVDELEVTDSEKPISIDELSGRFGITRQTLNNQFSKYLNLSPSEFRQICRFRKLVNSKIISAKKSPLTEFVYKFGFFDQSHLIKEFRKYTFRKPNDLFRQLTHSDEHIFLIWQ